MWGGKKSHFYFTANCHVSLSPVCLSLSHSVSSLSGSLAVRALVTKALNSDLPFLLASKIFMRTIRSSDKESAEGRATERAGCASRMSARLSVRPSVLQHSTPRTTDPRPHESEVQQLLSLLCPQSRQWLHASQPHRTPPLAPRPSRLRSALAPGLQGGGGRWATARTAGGRRIVAPQCMRARSHFPPLSPQGQRAQPTCRRFRRSSTELIDNSCNWNRPNQVSFLPRSILCSLIDS